MTNSQQINESEEEKNAKIRQRWDQDTIIEKGRELFTEKGFDLSMRDLARALNTQASSLYRHVESKRELWFAITTKDYEDFGKGMEELVRKHGNESALSLLKKVGYYFLEFARIDFNRFKLMYLYEPQREEKVGPFEQACKPDSLTNLIHLCQLIIEQEGLTKITAKELAIKTYSQILGYTIISSPINDYLLQQDEFKFIKDTSFDEKMLERMLEEILFYK